jgi:hypothetical protein
MTTIGGRHGDVPPGDVEGYLNYAKALRTPTIYSAIKHAKCVDGVARYGFPESVRRQFERLDVFPRGLLPIADASGLGGNGSAENALGKLRIDIRQHRPNKGSHHVQRIGRWRRRGRHVSRQVEVEARVLDHFGDTVSGMYAGETEAPLRAVEIEQAAVGDQRDRPAGAKDIFGAAARRADEIDFGHQRAARVLDAEQDYFWHDVIQIGGTERAGKTHLRMLVFANGDEVDVALAVDLAAREEEHIEPALAGAVEQFTGAVCEEGVGAAAQQRDVGPPATALARQQRRSCRDG